jgi:hypothetical protein
MRQLDKMLVAEYIASQVRTLSYPLCLLPSYMRKCSLTFLVGTVWACILPVEGVDGKEEWQQTLVAGAQTLAFVHVHTHVQDQVKRGYIPRSVWFYARQKRKCIETHSPLFMAQYGDISFNLMQSNRYMMTA